MFIRVNYQENANKNDSEISPLSSKNWLYAKYNKHKHMMKKELSFISGRVLNGNLRKVFWRLIRILQIECSYNLANFLWAPVPVIQKH